jgi:hypothetical protein
VDVIGQADVSISGQSLIDPPTTLNVSQNVNVTLRKTLHNNGGYGPVNVNITPSATAPSGCSATPNPANPASASLPVGSDVTSMRSDLHCTAPSTHGFTFSNAIAVSDPHVVDRHRHNSASTPLSLDVIGSADVRSQPDAGWRARRSTSRRTSR